MKKKNGWKIQLSKQLYLIFQPKVLIKNLEVNDSGFAGRKQFVDVSRHNKHITTSEERALAQQTFDDLGVTRILQTGSYDI